MTGPDPQRVALGERIDTASIDAQPRARRARPSSSDHIHSPFGSDRFGKSAERFARFFGTPGFIIGQTVLVLVWIALNAAAVGLRWDPYPFILLNLAFSTQAAYAAPLILLAQTRQADRDKATTDEVGRIADAQRAHVEEQSAGIRDLLAANTALTREIATLTAQIHAAACGPEL
jgi:uncharacterized membrane protein